MIDSFEKVWEKIAGKDKSYKEILEALREEISHRERLGAELHQNKDFKTLTKVEQERDAFVQTEYGIQDVPHLGHDESDIWKAARAKGIEIHSREGINEREAPSEPEITPHQVAPQPKGPNMAEVQAAETKASVIQGLNKSADGLSRIEGKDVSYPEEEYVIAAGQVKYEAQKARTADSEIKGRSDEGLSALKNPQIGQRVTFQPRESNKVKLTGKVVATDERTVTLNCGSKKIPTIRDKGDFFEAPPLKREQTKEFAKDRAQQLMGENGNVFFAQDKGAYKGKIIGLTSTYAIQKVNGETAILHRLKDLQSQDKNAHDLIREGHEVSIEKDENGVSITPWSKEREEKEKIREREKSRSAQSR